MDKMAIVSFREHGAVILREVFKDWVEILRKGVAKICRHRVRMSEFIKEIIQQKGAVNFLVTIVIGSEFQSIVILSLTHALERWHHS